MAFGNRDTIGNYWEPGYEPTQSLNLLLSILQRPFPGLIHYSDRGVHYTGHAYQQLLQAHQICPSMGRVGSCYDNVAMESFFGTLKSEWVHFQRFGTRQAAITIIFYYIESFYNRKRLHSANGYLILSKQLTNSYI